MSTLKDVAALAQCSLTTASIVANGRGDEMHISPATQQRVAEAIQQLQYRPDRGAQLLRAGRRRLTIALYWPLDHRTTLLGDRLYNFYSILQQEQEPADPYELLIQTYFSGRLGEMLSPILQGRYDGVIIGGAGEQDLIQLENADISPPCPPQCRKPEVFHRRGQPRPNRLPGRCPHPPKGLPGMRGHPGRRPL